MKKEESRGFDVFFVCLCVCDFFFFFLVFGREEKSLEIIHVESKNPEKSSPQSRACLGLFIALGTNFEVVAIEGLLATLQGLQASKALKKCGSRYL